MSVKEILREIESLPPDDRQKVLEGVRRLLAPEIPETPKPLRIQSLKGHRVLTPAISQAELAEELFRSS